MGPATDLNTTKKCMVSAALPKLTDLQTSYKPPRLRALAKHNKMRRYTKNIEECEHCTIHGVVNSVVCDNPLHNTQVEADGRCHWCEGKELI